MGGILGSKLGFYIFYILLFTIGIVQVARLINIEGEYIFKIADAEDRVVVYRIIKCASENNRFGIIDESKFDEEILKNCLGGKYSFSTSLKKSEGLNKRVEAGSLEKDVRDIARYVIVNGKGAKLEVRYSKNVA